MTNNSHQSTQFKYEQAQYFAIKALKMLATDDVSKHMEGLALLDEARKHNFESVEKVESELSELGENWLDKYKYNFSKKQLSQGKDENYL